MSENAMRPRDFVRRTRVIEKNVQHLVDAGYACAVSYGTKHGILKVIGSEELCEVICDNGGTITNRWQKHGAKGFSGRVYLPELKRPLDELTVHELKKILRALCLVDKGSGEVGWGRPEERPFWWPLDIEWTDKTMITKQGTPRETMRRLVAMCYKFYGREVNEGAPLTTPDVHTAADNPQRSSDPRPAKRKVIGDVKLHRTSSGNLTSQHTAPSTGNKTSDKFPPKCDGLTLLQPLREITTGNVTQTTQRMKKRKRKAHAMDVPSIFNNTN